MSGYIIGFIVLLILSAVFSMGESACMQANRLRIESAESEGKRSAAAALKMLDHMEDTLDAILLGNSLANIAATVIACAASVKMFGSAKWLWLAAICAFVLILLFGEVVPRIVAGRNANRLILSIAKPLRLLTLILTPISWTLGRLARLFTARMRSDTDDGSDDAAVEELQNIIETAEDESVLTEGRSDLLRSALDFSEVSASGR